jgi:hypothetical protein
VCKIHKFGCQKKRAGSIYESSQSQEQGSQRLDGQVRLGVWLSTECTDSRGIDLYNVDGEEGEVRGAVGFPARNGVAQLIVK